MLMAQDGDYGIKFSGFVKNDFFYDTRQTVSIREGHFLLYPAGRSYDFNNNDINAKPSFNFLSIQTRLTGKVTAPDVCKAKATAVIEADFFGNENTSFSDLNGFRLRHAYGKLVWPKNELLFGQYWHPLFIPGCFSGVISFNTGAPMQPFSRNPQIRATQRFGKFSITEVLAAQRDFTSPGGSAALRNSAIPDLHLQFAYENVNKEAQKEILAGFGGGYKFLKPLLNTEKGSKKFETDEMVPGLSATAFFKMKFPKLGFKLQGIYGQNLFDMTMLGGYAVSKITDTATNAVEYTSLNVMSYWAEFQTYGKVVQFGIWGGYTQNLGALDTIYAYTNSVGGTLATTRGNDIHHIWRVAPRVVFIKGRFNFALECEYTSAAYALKDEFGVIQRNHKGLITETEDLSNIRALFSVMVNF
jgi:hypothetical protein